MRRVHLKLPVEVGRRDSVRIAVVHRRYNTVVLEMQHTARSSGTIVYSLVLYYIGSPFCAFILAKEVRRY